MQVGIRAARSAGKILELYSSKIKNLKIKNNIPRDIFSKVDLMSEKEIYKTIIKKFGNDNFYGEDHHVIHQSLRYLFIKRLNKTYQSNKKESIFIING